MIDRICETCAGTFRVWPHKLREGRGRFCSKVCLASHARGRPRPKLRSLEERFWEKVDKRGPDECWPWIASKRTSGYGSIGHNGRVRVATHVAWELAHGKPWPAGKLACHTCDNPPCVNPSHLFVGTKQDNADDMAAKGRSTKGLRRQFCRNGHERTAENTYIYNGNGSIQCRDCRRVYQRAVYRSKQPGDIVICTTAGRVGE